MEYVVAGSAFGGKKVFGEGSIKHRNITPTPVKRYGRVIEPRVDTTTVYNADIEPGVFIRLHGIHQRTPFDTTFEIGGTASYDSFNLVYLGTITKIGPKTITITEGNTNHRLSLHEFSWRNYRFDEKRIAAENHETSHCI